MTRNEFNAICSERLIDPALALESNMVCEAIPMGIDAVIDALDKEF